MGDNMSLVGVLAICIVLGGSLGWLSYYLYAALIAWTGRWLNGEADTKDVFRILTYAIFPAVASLVLFVVQIILLGESMFKSDLALLDLDATTRILIVATGFLEVVLGIWSFVLLAIGVAEIQKFNYGKAVFNLLLPALVIGLPIVLLVFLVKG